MFINIHINMMATTHLSKRRSARLAALGKSETTTEKLLAQEKTRVAVLEAELRTSRQKEAATAKSLWYEQRSYRCEIAATEKFRDFIDTECTCGRVCGNCNSPTLDTDMRTCSRCHAGVCDDCQTKVEDPAVGVHGQETVCDACR
jgi:hypothetical protein